MRFAKSWKKTSSQIGEATAGQRITVWRVEVNMQEATEESQGKWLTPTQAGRLKATNAELLAAVKAAKEMVEWFMEHSRQADHAHEELGEKLEETKGWKDLIDSGYNGLMASYGSQFDEAIAKATASEGAV